MKKKILLILALALICTCAFSFTACGEKTPTASLNVVVIDNYGAPVKGAKVTICENKTKSQKTNSSGFVSFNLSAGSYKVRIEKSGYATVIKDAAIDLGSNVLGDVAVAKTASINATVYKTGVTATGKAVIYVNGVAQPLAGVELRLELTSSSFLNTLYLATTNNEGVYSFTNLPENAGFKISGPAHKSGDVSYDTYTVYGATGRIGDAVTPLFDDVVYTPASGQFFLASDLSLKLAAKNSAVNIEFSLPVDTAALLESNISSSSGILFTKSWSADKKTLTLRPLVGDWGNNGYTFNVTISSAIKSDTGITLGSSYSVSVTLPEAAAITTPAITGFIKTPESNTSDTFVLRWEKAANTTYTVYYRIVGVSNTFSTMSSYDNGELREVSFSSTLAGMSVDQTLQVVIYARLNGSVSDSAPQIISVTKRAS